MYYNYHMFKPVLIMFLLAAQCAPAFCAPKPAAAKPKPAAEMRGFCVFGGQTGKVYGDLAAFKTLVWKSDVIYAGSAGESPEDLRARLTVLKTMREARGSRIAVAFGNLASPLQPALDDYISGAISEEEFAARTDWRKQQAADFSFYKPLFDLIIQNKLKALAVGLPAEISSAVESSGLAALDPSQKALLPENVAISANASYLAALKTAFESRYGRPGVPSWDNYLAAVSAKNESAGAKIAAFLNSNPGWAALVLAGNDSLLYNAALPASVKSRTTGLRQASFYAEDAKCPAALPKTRKGLANYIWYVEPSTGPVPAR